jgi:hypothetical protein
MDYRDTDEYPKIIKEILIEYSKFKPAYGDIETYVVFDDERKHYQMVHIGWNNKRRTCGAIIYIRLKNGKVWLEYDGTENGVAEELVEAGIPKEQIVLGFRSPSLRKYTQYAVE